MGREAGARVDAGRVGEWRRQNVGRLFLRASRSFAARATRKLKERGHEGLGMSHTAVLPQLDADGGTRTTEIAEKAGMSKQVAGRVVRDLEKMGYVERTADPGDARATLIRFTDEGWLFLEDAYWVKREIEAEYEAVLGKERMGLLRSALEELLGHGEKAGG